MPVKTIADLQKEYAGRIDHLDLELLIAHTIKKPREFVMAHPEYTLSPAKIETCKLKLARRMRAEPLAYILGSKEFFGLPFLVSPATLIPRPETELMVEMALEEVASHRSSVIGIVDVGTGSGNIIISIAKNLESLCHPRVGGDPVAHQKVSTLDSRLHGNDRYNFYGIDISRDALAVAKRNAKKNDVATKIKFLHGNLLEPLIQNSKFKIQNSKMIILANLPYLSKKIYAATAPTVKKFEPKSALYSAKEGLAHYEKLFQQLKELTTNNRELMAILEFSPEQKAALQKLILKYFPKARVIFKKDLARKWRLAIITP